MLLSSCYEKGKDRTKNFPQVEVKLPQYKYNKNNWVFIMAGQSNMAGRAFVESGDTVPNKNILTINKKNEIILAKEPLHFYEPNMTGLDCGLSFGNELIKYLPDSISIYLIPCAVGGSSISQWIGDSLHRDVKLLTNFSEKVHSIKEYGDIKGILWHQGENDANKDDIPCYEKKLSSLFGNFRNIAGNDTLLILVGELGNYSPNNNDWEKINEQIREVGSNDHYIKIIETYDLLDKGDKVHFNSNSQRTLGKRYAQEYLKFLEK